MRKPDLERHVEQACAELLASGHQVTIAEVAARAGIGKATIYRRPELRALIEEHRVRGREALTLSGIAVQIDQLRRSLQAVAGKVQQHDEALRRLEKRSPSSDD